jgi:hypothetical protein
MGGFGSMAGMGGFGGMTGMGGRSYGGVSGGTMGASVSGVYGAMGAPPGGFVASLDPTIPPSTQDVNEEEAKEGDDLENPEVCNSILHLLCKLCVALCVHLNHMLCVFVELRHVVCRS